MDRINAALALWAHALRRDKREDHAVAAPIDLDHLARYTGGEKALNAEILKLFDAQIAEMVDQLSALLSLRDARRWREVAHTLKGAARGVGAFAMGEAAAAAEPVDPANNERAAAAIGMLEREAGQVHSFIRDYLAA